MIRTTQAFLWSLLIHLLILLLLVVSFKEVKMPPPQSLSPKKITLNLKQFTPSAPKPAVKPKPITPPALTPQKLSPILPVPQPQKKPIKEHKSPKQIPIASENNVTKPTKKTPPKPPKKAVKKTLPKKTLKPKQMFQKVQTRRVHSKDPLAKMLMDSSRSVTPQPPAPSSSSSFAETMIKSVYGKAFYSYDATQKQFIKDNLEEIFRVTQNTLWIRGYPDVAVQMNVEGTNVVSFYLHPNGSISDLRLRNAIGYRALDENTIETIKTAYKDYPRPQERTKIMFYVKYKLY